MSMDDEAIYVSTADGEVVALRARTGAEIWRQSALLYRVLSEPANMDDALVVGDYQGYLHWLDKSSGALAARVSTGKVRISNVPLVSGNIVVAVNDRGQINAYRVSPLKGAPAPKKAPAETEAPPAPAPTDSK